MSFEPILSPVICIYCGHEWEAFCPEGLKEPHNLECPRCHKMGGEGKENIDIKPCPFCGSKDIFINDTYEYDPNCSYGIEIGCGNCCVRYQFDNSYTTKSQAIDKWNKRV